MCEEHLAIHEAERGVCRCSSCTFARACLALLEANQKLEATADRESTLMQDALRRAEEQGFDDGYKEGMIAGREAK
jgi:flagellar biosynthesis/type III secretory pathway protein FliH